MKPRAFDLWALLLACLMAGAVCRTVSGAPTDTPPPLGTSPAPASVDVTPPPVVPKPGKKPKGPRDPNAPPKAPRIKKPKEIPFPLPINNSAKDLTIPENNLTGQLLSQIMAVKATRISNDLVRMEEMHMDLYHPDGKEDFHIDLPASVFNLQTHIITSDSAVTVRTQDFELTGEKMEFNTVDRTGSLIGHVHMHIHNLKQVAGLPGASPTP